MILAMDSTHFFMDFPAKPKPYPPPLFNTILNDFWSFNKTNPPVIVHAPRILRFHMQIH